MVSEPGNQRAIPPAPSGRPSRSTAVRQALFETLPGRLLIVGGLVKLSTWLLRVVVGVEVPALDAIGALGSVAAIIGILYFTFKLGARAKRRLLWRVRRKLILSYVFVGVVPVLLVVAFFLLCGLLLFLNVSSYLVARAVRGVEDDTRVVAETAANDIVRIGLSEARQVLAERQHSLARRYPTASMALVPTLKEPCGATVSIFRPGSEARYEQEPRLEVPPDRPAPVHVGSWTHLQQPTVLPSWVSCGGFSGLLAVEIPTTSADASSRSGTGLLIRSAVLAETNRAFAIIVDVPLDATLASVIHDETSVKLGEITLVSVTGDITVRPMTDTASNASSMLLTSSQAPTDKRRLPWVALLDWRDWGSGLSETASMHIDVGIGDVYDRLSAAQGRTGSSYSIWITFLTVLAILAVLFIIIEVVALVMGLVLARSITGSVHQLSLGTERVRQGDFGHKVKVQTRDQMGQLAESFNSMTASIEDLLRQAEEKKRLEEELRIARAIQMSLLPRGRLDVEGLAITALCVPAREVGGDYYDVLPLDDGRLGILIADVAGKGTSAALYMAELKGLMLSLSRIHHSPRQLLIEANSIIATNLDSRSFITMTYAVVDVRRGTMTYARAGHTPLMHRPVNGTGRGEVRVLAPDGLVVGLQMDDAGTLFERLLQEETIAMHPGDVFMLYTDGITEAMNGESECFGEARLGEILSEHGDLPSEELRERIMREIEAFVGGTPQHDDMTMILMKVEAVASRGDRPGTKVGSAVRLGASSAH